MQIYPFYLSGKAIIGVYFGVTQNIPLGFL